MHFVAICAGSHRQSPGGRSCILILPMTSHLVISDHMDYMFRHSTRIRDMCLQALGQGTCKLSTMGKLKGLQLLLV